MASNDYIIESLREGFEPDKYGRYTNCTLLFAYNGTGKTRLSYDFAHYGREEDTPAHTLYYNAYTEDLFTWDNDHENNTIHKLNINQNSVLIKGIVGSDIENVLRKNLSIFTDIEFDFDYGTDGSSSPKSVRFKKEVNGETYSDIKISRGEERLFVWCFFRCIIDQVLGDNDAYKSIEYIYIDDPMSSLDDNNVVTFAAQLYNVIRDSLKQELNDAKTGLKTPRRIKFIISSHHAFFFHVMMHGLAGDSKLGKFFLHRDKETDELVLKEMDDKHPFYYNVAMMSELRDAIYNDALYTYHFNILRGIMDKIKEFFGHTDYRYILDGISYKDNLFSEDAFTKGELIDLYYRMVNVFSHDYQFFSPMKMNEDNKDSLKTLFYHLRNKYRFQLPHLDDERGENEIRKERRNNR